MPNPNPITTAQAAKHWKCQRQHAWRLVKELHRKQTSGVSLAYGRFLIEKKLVLEIAQQRKAYRMATKNRRLTTPLFDVP